LARPEWEVEQTINGHPEMEPEGNTAITVCVECGQLRTILWLLGDRWYCTKCKTEGVNRPTVIPIS